MIDYFAHTAVLNQVRTDLAGIALSDPALVAQRDALLADVALDEDAALLGAFVDHLMVHASSDGAELGLLDNAADLWKRGRSLYDRIATCRQGVEAALANPAAPDAIAKFNDAIKGLAGFRRAVTEIGAESKVLHATVDSLQHLRPHPRQQDLAIENWDWGNRFLARRSDAFVRAVFANAQDGQSRAFAFGVLASYSGNAAGSAYLDHVVGGARRLHRYRDRLARNTVGAWITANVPLPDLGMLSKQLRFGPFVGGLGLGMKLPTSIASTLRSALAEAFPAITPPDLDLGLQRMVRHLELLAIFQRPPLPAPSNTALMPLLATLSATDSGGVHPASEDPFGNGDPAPGSGSQTPTTSDSKDSKGNSCLAFLILFILLVVVEIIDCIVQLIDKGECKERIIKEILEDDPPKETVVTTPQQLTTMASSPAGAHLVQELYSLQMSLWQAFEMALSYLAVVGLVYPDNLMLSLRDYTQFTSVPNRAGWPRRSEPVPEATYHAYPTSQTEQPTETASPFPVGANPLAFIGTALGAVRASAWEIARPLWLQIARKELDTANLDLDADRGFGHPCWRISAGTSINDDPIAVETLGYNDI